MKKFLTLFFFLYGIIISFSQTDSIQSKKEQQQAIIDEYYANCATKYNYYYQMAQWQECLDAGLEKDSTIAYLWQQKATPLFKTRKYEAGMVFLDKAVKLDEEKWLDYRGFIKCIFAKTYKEAILDFERCKIMRGNSYVMDHTYDFHIALSYLQLNEFEKAATIFKADIEDQISKYKAAHYLDLFYYGITLYEQKKWNEAISIFDKSLEQYPEFSDVKFYKGICLAQLGRKEESKLVFEESENDFINGYTINEDQIFYETYPYQVKRKE